MIFMDFEELCVVSGEREPHDDCLLVEMQRYSLVLNVMLPSMFPGNVSAKKKRKKEQILVLTNFTQHTCMCPMTHLLY